MLLEGRVIQIGLAFRCQSALLSIDGPKWREKLPPMPSYQVPAMPIGTNSSTSTSLPSVPTNEPKNVKSLFNKDSIFEVQKNLGNDCVKKVKMIWEDLDIVGVYNQRSHYQAQVASRYQLIN